MNKIEAQEWRSTPTGNLARIDGQWFSVNGSPETGISDVRFKVPDPGPHGFAAALGRHYDKPTSKPPIRRASPRPSIKALARAFGEDKAPLLRRILVSESREELMSLSSDADDLMRQYLTRQSWWKPRMQTLRFVALSQVLDGFGEESFLTRCGYMVTYVNMGDTYSTTILKFRGTYRVGDWGTLAEKHGSHDGLP